MDRLASWSGRLPTTGRYSGPSTFTTSGPPPTNTSTTSCSSAAGLTSRCTRVAGTWHVEKCPGFDLDALLPTRSELEAGVSLQRVSLALRPLLNRLEVLGIKCSQVGQQRVHQYLTVDKENDREGGTSLGIFSLYQQASATAKTKSSCSLSRHGPTSLP